MRTTNRTRGARTALVLGSAFAAPMAVVGVAGALSPGAAEPAAEPSAAPAAPEVELPEADVDAAQAFWDAGYQYCDAEALAAARGTDVWESKLATGRLLQSGAEVAPPSGCADEVEGVDSSDATALNAFWDAGYRYCDAEALAASVGVADPFEAKVAIGAALVAGTDVPAPTGCDA